ncbi:PAS domain-containing sensor histidine kinase [Brevundimonas sp.]|uniref:sensor histidine kinase NtrY-like n=1 Tax=Brevundimonas sp. TaxID=1871086 RepID=UPI002D5E412A|nr:PAS domain-containing sensor histidine kinase [Brevundimonas sp.]HYD29105.1 PAS domain-containing sensor histidine kinase [Brevundimonas sp.]
MLNAFVRKGAPALTVFQAWPGSGRGKAVFGLVYGVAVIVTGLAIWLVASAPAAGPITPASQVLLWVLGLNLLAILSLAAAMFWRVVRLARERDIDAGARLRLRFVTLFAVAAVVPAVIVALFFGVLVTRGVESWFSERVRSTVDNSAEIAKAYVDQESGEVGSEVAAMAGDLSQPRVVAMFPNRLTFSRALEELASIRGFVAVYIIDGQGQVLARAEAPQAPPYAAPPPSTIATARGGEVPVGVFPDPDLVRGVATLEGYGDAYVYGVRSLQNGIVGRLRDAEQAIVAYREAEESRARIQSAFILVYVETALLVLVGAVWLGMAAAGAIAAPVARLVQAADRVAGGDLDVRVEADRDVEEIAVLSRAFNRMTSDLQTQQEALKNASAEAQARRRFIETVLSGVSAGVVGLDARGRVSAVNRQALSLLSLTEAEAVGQALAKVAPELATVVQGPPEAGEQEVDVIRGGDTRRLRVRVSDGEEGGLILTFDDITRLVTAQRNAAWKDVARRIAHEIKNPLTPIQLSAERLRRKYRSQLTDDLDTFDRCTDTIIRQVGDIGRMVDEFSAFARMPAPKFAEEDPAELLRQAVFAQRVAQPEVHLELVEPLPAVRFVADGRMVGQALTNVLKNAGEAVMARRAVDSSAPNNMRAALVLEGDGLAFVVEDDGVGLPVKDRDRLTEPYVTTREKGTGLGLAIVKRICEDHGGELELADAVELTGARVALRFPRTSKGAARPSAAA